MKSKPDSFPWELIMQFGLGTLALPPEEFWKMSVLEIKAALKAHTPSQPEHTSREWLSTAMKQHPDKGEIYGFE